MSGWSGRPGICSCTLQLTFGLDRSMSMTQEVRTHAHTYAVQPIMHMEVSCVSVRPQFYYNCDGYP